MQYVHIMHKNFRKQIMNIVNKYDFEMMVSMYGVAEISTEISLPTS